MNHYINILNQNGILNHFGASFKLPGITNLNNLSKANMDSSGITFLTYLNDSNEIEFKQFGADGNDINSIQIIGRNVLSNLEIEKIAQKYNLKVIYDAAHCFGVQYNGESIFNFGDVSTCSFHATKIFHTGEGGCMITKNQDLHEKLFFHI